MKISTCFTGKYLSSATLDGAEPVVVIADVTMEDFDEGRRRPVLYFRGKDAGLALNRTNATMLAELFGDETADWIGQRVQLFAEDVFYKGEQVKGLRVRAAPVRAAPPPPPPRSRTADDLDDDVPF